MDEGAAIDMMDLAPGSCMCAGRAKESDTEASLVVVALLTSRWTLRGTTGFDAGVRPSTGEGLGAGESVGVAPAAMSWTAWWWWWWCCGRVGGGVAMGGTARGSMGGAPVERVEAPRGSHAMLRNAGDMAASETRTTTLSELAPRRAKARPTMGDRVYSTGVVAAAAAASAAVVVGAGVGFGVAWVVA